MAATTVGFSGCSGDREPGTPSPQASTAAGAEASTAGTTAGAPSGPTPARPVDLPLAGLRPCDLFTDDVRRQFELEGSPSDGADSRGQPDCQMRSRGHGGYIVAAVHQEGMERFENIPQQLATVRRFDIAGFPAAELRDRNQPFACLIGIDVADGQHLAVYVTDAPRGGTQDEICRNAVTFAEAVLTSLRQQLER